MPSQTDKKRASLADRFWAIYDKVWWLFAALFFGGVCWLLITNRTFLFLRIFGGVFAVAGVAGLVLGWRTIAKARRSEDWFPVEGLVVSSRLDGQTDRPSSDSPGPDLAEEDVALAEEGMTEYKRTYWPRIEFEYQFQGETYRSDRINFAETSFPRQQAEELVARNPVGARVQVYVDPDHPRQAVLEKGLAGKAKQYALPFIVGGIFLAPGLLLWFLAPHLAGPREAVHLKPTDPEAHYNLGNALLKKRDWDGANREFREAIRLKPHYPGAHGGLGWALANKKDWDGAIREYREAIRLEPEYPEAHGGLGWALEKKNDWDGAIREYREAIRLEPDYADAHYNLGNALLNKRDWDGAIRESREAIRLKPDDADAHYNLGVALERKGDLQAGLNEYRAASTLDPQNADFKKDYERLLKKMK